MTMMLFLFHVMKKPAFCICENKGADQLCRYNKEEGFFFSSIEFRVVNFEFRVEDFEFRVENFEFRVKNFEFRV